MVPLGISVIVGQGTGGMGINRESSHSDKGRRYLYLQRDRNQSEKANKVTNKTQKSKPHVWS